ncbi:helix-turn-helix domain-containing protein [Paraburkholderia solisilvae]|uniref:helix-turn-helix domain-containing protein n=1 Tax=Paraburkholderia solisilvae TaxID=624376 RepID=UPI001582323D|nr:helix-turn-helix domain-containing protein [Paraburkholderia solisilvae]
MSNTRADAGSSGHRRQGSLRVDWVLVEFESDESFAGEIVERYNLGSIDMVLLEVANLSVKPDSDCTERYLYLSVIASGDMTVKANGGVHHVDAGKMLLIDLDTPHSQHFNRRSQAVLLRAPRKLLANRGFHKRRLGLVSPDITAPDVRAISATIVLLAQQRGSTSHELRRRQGEHLLDILSMLIDEPPAHFARRSSRATLIDAKRFISQNIGNAELSVSLVASAVGTSGAHLHRLFRADGHSLMHYVLCQRLDLAVELLTKRPERRMHIKEVAYRCGFSSHAHFSRVFRQRFGISPKCAGASGLKVERKSDDDPAI